MIEYNYQIIVDHQLIINLMYQVLLDQQKKHKYSEQ